MEITRIFESDTWDVMARKIFRDFVVGQSCSIIGFVNVEIGEPTPKGILVALELERLDKFSNSSGNARDGKWRRRRVKPANSIGDFTAQKQWVYKKQIIEGNKIKVDIWRTQ